jgi:hypothetical protein
MVQDNDSTDGMEESVTSTSVAHDTLKTSHLRRIVEPVRRVGRNSSYNSGVGGSLASSAAISAASSLDEDPSEKSVRGSLQGPNRMGSERWRPPASRKISRDAGSAVELDSGDDAGGYKGDCAPVSPQRRSSTSVRAGSVNGNYSASRLGNASLSSSVGRLRLTDSIVSSIEGEEISVSERIEEEGEEASSSYTSSDDIELLDITVAPGDDETTSEDIFTIYSWSLSHHSMKRFQVERSRLHDSIRATPLFRALEKCKIGKTNL